MKPSYSEVNEHFQKCHRETRGISAMSWALRMEGMLGPNDCKGFIIRGREGSIRGMYLKEGDTTWCGFPRNARVLTWLEAAVKITNNPRLEAIRVQHDNVAVDYKGNRIPLGKDKDG